MRYIDERLSTPRASKLDQCSQVVSGPRDALLECCDAPAHAVQIPELRPSIRREGPVERVAVRSEHLERKRQWVHELESVGSIAMACTRFALSLQHCISAAISSDTGYTAPNGVLLSNTVGLTCRLAVAVMQRSIRKKRTPPVTAPARSRREEPRWAPGRALSATAMIEAQLGPASEPVIGLFLHVAYMYVMSTFDEQIGHGEITPNLIGVLALVNRQPGTNQAELARLIGLERATVGEQVLRAVERGFLRRDPSPHDARSYSLHVTSRGTAMLAALRQRIPLHERAVGAKLTLDERKQLRTLLDKLVYG